MPRASRPRAAAKAPSTGYTAPQISRHISTYFTATAPGDWDLEAFIAHCRTHSHFAAKKTPAMINYWLTELKNIVAGGGKGEGVERARAVQDAWRERNSRRVRPSRYTATNSIVVHGDIINSSVSNIAGTLPAAPPPESEPEPEPEPEPAAEGESGAEAEDEPAPEPEPDTDPDARVPTITPGDITAPGDFLQRAPAMTHKARLTSGKALEDTLHTYLQQTAAPSPLLTHGIIDREDNATAALFTTDEMKAISALAPPPPAQDPAFEYACARYTGPGGRQDTAWYRVVSETPPRPEGVQYDARVNFNATYVNHAVGAILGNMEHLAEMCSFAPEPNEGWFDANIWAPLIDYCFKDLHGVSLSRKEIMSRAAPHFRFDGILLQHQSGHGPREYGAIEVGRNTAGTKRHTDKLKLVHILHAMLHRLAAEVGNQWGIARGLETVGIHNVGASVQILRMSFVSRNVCILRTGPVHPVPSRFEGVADLFPAMRAVVAAKLIIKRSIEIVKGYEHEGWADDI